MDTIELHNVNNWLKIGARVRQVKTFHPLKFTNMPLTVVEIEWDETIERRNVKVQIGDNATKRFWLIEDELVPAKDIPFEHVFYGFP